MPGKRKNPNQEFGPVRIQFLKQIVLSCCPPCWRAGTLGRAMVRLKHKFYVVVKPFFRLAVFTYTETTNKKSLQFAKNLLTSLFYLYKVLP
jgi:hypothetical protein